jgi:hypothetical protein
MGAYVLFDIFFIYFVLSLYKHTNIRVMLDWAPLE